MITLWVLPGKEEWVRPCFSVLKEHSWRSSSPSGKVLIRAEMSGPKRVKADVWGKIRQEKDHPREAVEIDPWSTKSKQYRVHQQQRRHILGKSGKVLDWLRHETMYR